MKKLYTSLLIALFALSWLAGCSTVKTTELTVDTVKTVYVKIPESLLAPCLPAAPMDTTTYLTLTLDERELTLSKYIITLYGTLAVCNAQLSNIKDLNDRVDK